MAKAKLGRFDDLVRLANEPLKPVVERLRAVILEIHPGACEVVRLGDRAATYGCGPRKMIDGYAYLMPHKSWVNLGFYSGASLADPENLLEGTGARMRHVKMRTVADVERPGVRGLVSEACAERMAALGLAARGKTHGI